MICGEGLCISISPFVISCRDQASKHSTRVDIYRAHGLLTILPPLSPAAALLALQQGLAAALAVASQEGIFARLERGSGGCAGGIFALVRVVEGDGEGDAGSARRGRHAEGLQRRHGPGFDVYCGGRGGLLRRGRDGGVDRHGEDLLAGNLQLQIARGRRRVVVSCARRLMLQEEEDEDDDDVVEGSRQT
jgi:hypothetical protein